MSATNIHTTSELVAARELRTTMQGRVLFRGDNDYKNPSLTTRKLLTIGHVLVAD
jgi:hypothetical protein